MFLAVHNEPPRNETDRLLEEYATMFNDSFPSFILGMNTSIMSECLHKGKDVYELGYIDKNNTNKY